MEIDNLVIKAEVEEAKKQELKSHPWKKEEELEWLIEKCTDRIFQHLENRST